MAPSTTPDWYAIVGAEPGSSPKEIARAYRKKALVCHPDKRPGDAQAAEAFAALQAAYDVLSDETKRAAYDAQREAQALREARFRAQDGRRREMRDRLEAQEEEARRAQAAAARPAGEATGPAAERAARAALERELEALRAKRARAAHDARRRHAEERGEAEVALSLRWGPGTTYSEGLLEALLRSVCPPSGPQGGGPRFTVAVSKGGKRQAVAAFRSPEDAAAVIEAWADAEAGGEDLERTTGISVERVGAGAAERPATGRDAAPAPRGGAVAGVGAAVEAAGGGAGAGRRSDADDDDPLRLTEYEAVTLERMRQAALRRKVEPA